MDRIDDDQEGINLSPASTTRLLAREEASALILQHIHLCPFAMDRINDRLRNVEMSIAKLIGFMIGSGLLGGIAGGIAHKLWP